MFLIILLVIALLLGLVVMSNYNKLVRLKNAAEESKNSINVFLKQRYELIPNLVETIKGATNYESSTLEKVIRLRNVAASGSGAEQQRAEKELTSMLPSILAVGESYPQLQAVEGFTQLQSSLSRIEEEIQRARRYYNATARDLNTAMDTFPSNLVVDLAGVTKQEYFEVSEVEQQAVKVKF